MPDDPLPRPMPETTGVTLYLRFDNELIGQRNIGKVRLENISDPRNPADPLAMFESLFYGGEKELVVDQAIMNADRFLGGQTVNQFARIRPGNPTSRSEINKLTLLMQDKRQPVSKHVMLTLNPTDALYSSGSSVSGKTCSSSSTHPRVPIARDSVLLGTFGLRRALPWLCCFQLETSTFTSIRQSDLPPIYRLVHCLSHRSRSPGQAAP